ncbi:MAG: hypothetical protein WC789_09305 [Lentisphaeria bacterium]
MATAATVAAPFPIFTKLGNLDVGLYDGTMPADASGGLYWTLGWANVICAVVVGDLSVATADVGPFAAKFASGVLTAYGVNEAACNDAHVIAIVIGNQ